MNALIRKEARLLLPSTVVGLLLTTMIWFSKERTGSFVGVSEWLITISSLACPAMLVMLTLDAFGVEISTGTFSQLLSQPVPRKRIWRIKTLLLALAVVVVTGSWCLAIAHLKFAGQSGANDKREFIKLAIMLSLAAYSGGLWTVLLLRQVAAAFWFTILPPIGIMAITVLSLDGQPEKTVEAALFVVLIAYSIGGFLFARRLFLRAQDVDWTGRNIEMPTLGRFFPSRNQTVVASRGWRPRAALIAKEFQLHQPILLMAGVLGLLHLVVILLRNFGGDFTKQPVMQMILSSFWMLWLVMPLLIGCTAVAEERKLGTLAAQLCLPVKRGRQFRIKFGVVLFLSVLLGAVVPALLEYQMFLDASPSTHTNQFVMQWMFSHPETFSGLERIFPMILLTIGSAAVGGISFYISTFTRTTLQSLGPAAAACSVAWFLLSAATSSNLVTQFNLWRGPIVYLIAGPIMLITLFGLMRSNFKHVFVPGRVFGFNALMLGGSLVAGITLASATYHRAWELLAPGDPVHGPARLAQQDLAKMDFVFRQGHVQLRDGRVWTASISDFKPGPAAYFAIFVTGDWVRLGPSAVLPETNWTGVTISYGYAEAAGIQSDGSLWISKRRRVDVREPTLELLHMTRFGDASDWQSVAAGWMGDLFLLKTNGALWHLGTNEFARGNVQSSLRDFNPERIGTNSDWAGISSRNARVEFRKSNGQTWQLTNWEQDDDEAVMVIGSKLKIGRTRSLDGVKASTATWPNRGGQGGVQVGICEDGTFRVVGGWQPPVNPGTNRTGAVEMATRRDQIGTETNWLDLAGNTETLITLKADGTLWRWDFTDGELQRPSTAIPTRLDSHLDWIGITSTGEQGFIGLAADGSLWRWVINSNKGEAEFTTLLRASRKPRLLGNIFTNSGQ